ncbi:MAG: hypothetical protein Q8Q02_16470 [Nocardioides sp.]|nr:hypothetical protein [Nocardioides sp.]
MSAPSVDASVGQAVRDAVPGDVTAPLQAAIAEAEELIRTAPFLRTEQDLLEGYDYLSGRIRASLQLAFDHDLDRPLFINSTHQFSRQGLDNPDAIYFHAYLRDDAEYVVHGRRGTSADLSFQVMAGTYSADSPAGSLAAFDDRGFPIADDGSFEIRFLPASRADDDLPPGTFVSGEGAKTLIVREVFNDWDTEERGTLWIERVDSVGHPAAPLTRRRLAQKYEVAAKMVTGTIQTWLAFPHFFQYKEPVNTLTPPRSTPGGLESQRSSIGHYELADDEALVVSVPECADCSYQAIQVGSDWYASTDYETHQTSMTKAQSVTDPDGVMRYVISEQDPGIANWLECTGHRTGSMMLRWQRLERDLSEADGPTVEKVKIADVASALPHFAPITPEERTARIAARQRSVARRMLS